MPSLATIKESNSKVTDQNVPKVAVFVGATAGIAKAALTLLVSKKALMTVYVLGRNETKHTPYLEGLRALNPRATIHWMEGQVTLLSEVQRICNEIKQREKSLDLLFLSAGYLPFGGRVESSEGLETSNVLNYWHRALFTQLLLPLFRHKSQRTAAYAPRVISILAAGEETDSIPLDDLDLRQPQNFGVTRTGPHQATLNTLFFSRLASQPENSGVVFIHNHPGVISTGITSKNWGDNWWGPVLVTLLEPILHFFLGTTIEDSAERSLYLITSGEYGGIGVELQEDGTKGLTDTGEASGGLFCVSKDMQCIQPAENVVSSLKAQNGYEIVWEETQHVVAPFL